MKKKCVFFAFASALGGLTCYGDAQINDVFASLYNSLGITNVTQNAFVNYAKWNWDEWYRQFRAARPNMTAQDICAWYQDLASAIVPVDEDFEGTNRWIGIKGFALYEVACDESVVNSTNCWIAAANEHGRIRASLRTEGDWNVLLGYNQCEHEVMPDGVVLISVPGLFGNAQLQRDAMVAQMKREQGWHEREARQIKYAIEEFAKSSVFRGLPYSERNAIVSNIVELARLTTDEAAKLGLTNVVETAGE